MKNTARILLFLILAVLFPGSIVLAGCDGSTDNAGTTAADIASVNNDSQQAGENSDPLTTTTSPNSLNITDSVQRQLSSMEIPKPQSGKVHSMFEIDCRVFHGADLAGGTLYVDCGSTPEGLIAIDLQSGAEKWRFQPGVFVANPFFRDGVIYASSDSSIYAVDAATGAEKWNYRYRTSDERASSANSPSIGAESVFVMGVDDQAVHALDKTTGQEKWKADVGPSYFSPAPLVAGDLVFVTSYEVPKPVDDGRATATSRVEAPVSRVHALNAATGQEVWTYEKKDMMIMEATAVVDGRLFVIDIGSAYSYALSDSKHQRSPSMICSVDARTGQQQWCFASDSSLMNLIASDGKVFVAEAFDIAGDRGFTKEAGRIYGLDAETGQESWSFDTEGKIETSVFVAGHAVVFGSKACDNSGCVTHTYARDTQTGDHKWMIFNEQPSDDGLPPLKLIYDGVPYFMSMGDYKSHIYQLIPPA